MKQWDVVSRRVIDVPDNPAPGAYQRPGTIPISQQAQGAPAPQGLAAAMSAPPTATPAPSTPERDLVAKIYGGGGGGYEGVVRQGYENLNQPGINPNTSPVTSQLVGGLADTFVTRFHQKTGQLPTEDQVRQYVAANATAGNAQKYIQGGLNTDQMLMLADQHLQMNPDLINGTKPQTTAPAVQTLEDLNTKLPGLYDQMRTNLGNYTDTAFAAPRKMAIEDEAALGRLRSPASIPNIANVDVAKANALQGGLTNIGLQQLSGQTDLSKALAGVQQEQEKIGNQASQFGQELGLRRLINSQDQDINQQNIALQNRQLGLAAELGRRQAGSQSNNGLAGGLGGALAGGIGMGALKGAAGGPLGIGLGALAGGLAGYFGSRRD